MSCLYFEKTNDDNEMPNPKASWDFQMKPKWTSIFPTTSQPNIFLFKNIEDLWISIYEWVREWSIFDQIKCTKEWYVQVCCKSSRTVGVGDFSVRHICVRTWVWKLLPSLKFSPNFMTFRSLEVTAPQVISRMFHQSA